MLVAGSAIFEYAHRVPAGLSETFGIFAEPENLERLTPRWMQFRMVETPRQLEAGMLIRYRIAPFGLAMEWVAQITKWNPPHVFADAQLKGPYRHWSHTHRIAEVSGGVEIRDRVEYRLPGGLVGRAVYRSRRIDQLIGVASGKV